MRKVLSRSRSINVRNKDAEQQRLRAAPCGTPAYGVNGDEMAGFQHRVSYFQVWEEVVDESYCGGWWSWIYGCRSLYSSLLCQSLSDYFSKWQNIARVSSFLKRAVLACFLRG